MSILIDGKEIAKEIRKELKEKILKEENKPTLAVILIGNNDASKIYVRNKNKACIEIGMDFVECNLSEEITQEELLDVIDKLNKDQNIDGILLQCPIPKHLNKEEAFEKIDKNKDVDCFNPYNIGLLDIGKKRNFATCTPAGIIEMLKYYNIEIEGKNAVVLGRSNIVGKPMGQMLLENNATVTICHSKTKKLQEIIKNADILVSAIGILKYIKADMIKDKAVVIDVGMNRDENNKLCGDVDFEEVSKKASYITPVPGGVGPMTIAMLLKNTIRAHELMKEKSIKKQEGIK